uniref:uncharacterized protein C6orf163 homolog n=1 Tax=Pristiophorus japonicus TaxID=55135 RepID=UPI00398F237D
MPKLLAIFVYVTMIPVLLSFSSMFCFDDKEWHCALMDSWCINIKSRKSLLVTPDGGTPGLPTWYKEPTHALIQQDTHKCIIELGSQIHRRYMEECNHEWKQNVEEAKEAIVFWTKKEKEEAVKKVLLEAEQEKKKEIEALKMIHKDEIKKAIEKTEIKMRWEIEKQVSKEHEKGKQRLAHEIEQLLFKCGHEKAMAVAAAQEEEKKIASNTLEQVIIKLKYDTEVQHQFILQESLQLQKEEYEAKISTEVAKARSKEKEQANEPIVVLQSRHQSEIDQLKCLLCDKEVNLKEVYDRVETMTVLELELETELQNTRTAFQDYINLTYPNLAPGQAEFILPLRPMCQDLGISLPTCKPHKTQKRPQK